MSHSSIYDNELDQKPFKADEFIERLANRILTDVSDKDINFTGVELLEQVFAKTISDLTVLMESQKTACNQPTTDSEKEERFQNDLITFQEMNNSCTGTFYQLDDKISVISSKVLHLGEQLEAVNVLRMRSFEAYKLMKCFCAFLKPGPVDLVEFTDIQKVDEAADMIQKVYQFSQESPSGLFEDAKKKILAKYDEIERSLIEEFVYAHRLGNLRRMKELAAILSNFKGYSRCIDAFIEECQTNFTPGHDIFNNILPLCERTFDIVSAVFKNPSQVNGKFVLNIYQLKLQAYVGALLSDTKDSEKYLQNFTHLYYKSLRLQEDLSKFQLGGDQLFLKKNSQSIFNAYVDAYIGVELHNLKKKCSDILEKFYESKGHQKKQINVTSFQDLRRDLQAVIGTRANINIAQIEDYGNETFLSEHVTRSILKETREAFNRCKILSKKRNLQSNMMQLFEILMRYMIGEYVEYAIDIAIQAIPIPETKSKPPEFYFFNVAKQVDATVTLLEEQLLEFMSPLRMTSMKLGDYTTRKKYILDETENKLDFGLDRVINSVVGWVKVYLQTEQKRTDFASDEEINTVASPACKSIVQYMRNVINLIRSCLGKKNANNVLIELGVRFHRVIYEHILQSTYNSAGALSVICDGNEYRKCVKDLNYPLLTTLFNTLHSLCNLLLVKPENLDEVCGDETLAVLDPAVLLTFIQLRTDFKTQKSAFVLKNFSASRIDS